MMPRYKKLDRNNLLDAAEKVIREQGAHALSIGTVASAAGVSKGGIQSNFGSRDGLIAALFERWNQDIEDQIQIVKKSMPCEADEVDVFLLAARAVHLFDPKRNAALYILMSQSEELRSFAREWIANKMKTINPNTAIGRRKRLTFLIKESILAVKSLELISFTDEEWAEIFNDLDNLLK